MASRVRQFNNIRDKRLSQSNSQLYFSSRNSQCYGTIQACKNLTKKEPICLDCVNNKLISQKKQKLKKQKQQQLCSEKQFQKIKLNQEDLRNKRNKMLKQASRYNQKAVQQHYRKEQFQRKQDQNIVKSTSDLFYQLIENQSILEQQNRKKAEQYRRGLQQQFKQQSLKKELIKRQKFATQPNQSFISNRDQSQILKKYEIQLKKQIKQNQRTTEQLKKMQNQIDRQIITNFDQDFFKYSQFKQKNKNKPQNPEIFQQMKRRQVQKKLDRIEQRQNKQKERKQQLMRVKKQAELTTQKSLKTIKSYASILETQIAAKRRQKQSIKTMKRHEFLEQFKKEDEKQQVNKKPCGQCCKNVNEIALSYY